MAGKAYLQQVESNLPKLAAKPALILWPDRDPGFGHTQLRLSGSGSPDAGVRPGGDAPA